MSGNRRRARSAWITIAGPKDQARGTNGRALQEGARSLLIFGEPVSVKAHVRSLSGFSAHAGKTELVEWVTPMVTGGAQVVLVHGENEKRAALAAKLRERAGKDAWQPLRGDTISIPRDGAPLFTRAERATRELVS